MYAKASALVRLITSGRYVHRPGAAGVREACLAVLIMLVVQYGLGIFLNLYVTVPASDQHAGLAQEIASGPVSLTIHALLGLMLLAAAIVLIARATRMQSRAITLLATLNLSAIAGAFAGGEIFVRNGRPSASLAMAVLTGVALLCDISTLALISMAERELAPASPHMSAPAPVPAPAPPLPRRADTPHAAWPAVARPGNVSTPGPWAAAPFPGPPTYQFRGE